MTRARLSRRGQNLVLLALTMLFLVLMVTMTLGLGMRLRQKHELQNLADAAAYSNAVMEARAFNNISVINRLQVSYWVAMAADQSLISWTGYSRGMAYAAHRALDQLEGYPAVSRNITALGQVQSLKSDVLDYYTNGFPSWENLDKAAGFEVADVQSRISQLRFEVGRGIVTPSPDSVSQRLFDKLEDQTLTKQVIAASGVRHVDVLPVTDPGHPASLVGVNRREVDCDFGGTGNEPLEQAASEAPPGICSRRPWNDNQLYAAMGTRGDAFVVGRGRTPPKVLQDIQVRDDARDLVSLAFSGVRGSAFWGPRNEEHAAVISTLTSIAEDHGTVTASSLGCSATADVMGRIESTWYEDTRDVHKWTGREEGDSEVDHTLGECTPACPSVWVRSVGFSPSNDAADNYGQPKVVAALQRDLARQKFPWELHFSFPFSATGPARGWDGRGEQLKGGLNIAHQTAWATGVIYYHRDDHWDEFPNMMNPFWRATLAPSDVDAQAHDDIKRVLNQPGHRWQSRAYDALMRAGYQGLH